MSERFWILLGVSLIVAALILAVLRLAFRDPGRSEPVDLAAYFMPPRNSTPPAAHDDEPSWWLIGVLSDVRRRAAAPDAPPLEEPVTWLALKADWDRVRNLGTRRTPADVGPHGGSGWAFSNHAHQDGRYLDQDGRYLAEVPA